MTTLVVGATGATGKLLVSQLLARGEQVRAIVRSINKLPEDIREHPNFSAIEAGILELIDQELTEHVRGCTAVASCLGHNLTFKGMFGHPRRLVTDATRRLCRAIKANESAQPTKFVLMNTTGVRNRDLDETISFAQHLVIGLIRVCVPPHADNEGAAHYLRTEIGQDDKAVQWAAVRPDSLVDQDAVSEYELHTSPTRSAIFDSGKTSRINVARFMADLIISPEAWQTWKGAMPVIYNIAEQDVADAREI
ncbi:MAG: NAD(P)-dependent oxidoreductase [Akkermansiaceae bacterium]